VRETLSNLAGKPTGKNQRIKRSGQTAMDILKQMRKAEYNSRATSKKLASQIKAADPYTTCKRMYSFLKHGMNYRKEPASRQTAKEIKRYLSDGFGDCKHYATTSVGILNACGIPAWFVLVSQSKYRKSPNHAYCCAMVNNEVLVIDPCRPSFNNECTYFFKYDLPPIRSKNF